MSHSVSGYPPVISNCAPDPDGYVVELVRSNWSNLQQKIEPPCRSDMDIDMEVNEATSSGHELGYKECINDDTQRPTSRHAYYRSGTRYGTRCSRIPPLKVKRYPFILDGNFGNYTLAQICRYARIAPIRGTAMQLRRFVLLNDFLDRTKAVDYERPPPATPASDGIPNAYDSSHSRWPGHGASKLRNEISLEDLTNDDSDAEISFNSASIDDSFNSRRISDKSISSKYSDDYEVPMELTSVFEDDDEDEDISDVLEEYDDEFLEFFESTFSNLSGCEDMEVDENEVP